MCPENPWQTRRIIIYSLGAARALHPMAYLWFHLSDEFFRGFLLSYLPITTKFTLEVTTITGIRRMNIYCESGHPSLVPTLCRHDAE